MSGAETQVSIDGMTCGKCAARVKKALDAVPGVLEARVDHATGHALVTHEDTVTPEALRAAVDAAGYTVRGDV
jgi:copper chaperone CopZ